MKHLFGLVLQLQEEKEAKIKELQDQLERAFDKESATKEGEQTTNEVRE